MDARVKPGHDDRGDGARATYAGRRADRISRHAQNRTQPLDHPSGLSRRARPAEVISLHRGAAAFADEIELLHRLDAFRRGLDAEHGAEARDGADDGDALGAFAERADEGAVDLDAVERKFALVTQ